MITDATQDVSSIGGARRRQRRAPLAFGDTQNPSSQPQAADSPTAQPAQSQTFAQMQASGQARPNPRPQPTGLPGGFQSQVGSALSGALPPAQQAQRESMRANLEAQFRGQNQQLDEEMARRGIGASSIAGGRLGDLRGQQARALATADADLLSSAQQQAEQSRQFDLQQQLAERLGLGNLGLQERSLAQSGSQFDRTFGLQQQIQTGQLTLQQAQQQLNERVQTGQLSLAQANQALQELQNSQQFGVQQQQLGESRRQFDLQQQLAQTLGLGGLDLQRQGLAQSGSQFDRSLGEQGRQFNMQQELARILGLGNLDLQRDSLQQSGQQFDQTFGLSSEIQRGNMSLAQAQQALNERVQTGQLSLAQANQALQELQNSQQFGLQSNAQNIQQSQFGQQLQQALELARMSDTTANRGIDVQGRLAENDLWLRVAQLLAGMGYPVNGSNPNTGTIPDDVYNPTGGDTIVPRDQPTDDDATLF